MRIPIDSLPLQDVITLPGGIPDTSTEYATMVNAQFLWRGMHVRAQKGREHEFQGTPGREITVNVAKVLEEIFLGMTKNQESKNARHAIYDWLRDSKNMQCLQSLGPVQGGVWWVADEWNGFRRGQPAPAESALMTYGARKLKGGESGEHRDPDPVIAGYRCTAPGCPDTQVFPHSGALEEHRRQAHPDNFIQAELITESGVLGPMTDAEIEEFTFTTADEDGPVIQPVIQPENPAEDAPEQQSGFESGFESQSESASYTPATGEFSYDDLSKRIFDAIQASGKSQRQVAAEVGLHGSTISAMITGRQRISVEQMFRIAEVTGTPVTSLLGLPAPVLYLPGSLQEDKLLPASPTVAPTVAEIVSIGLEGVPASRLLSLLAGKIEEMESGLRAATELLEQATRPDEEESPLVISLRARLAEYEDEITVVKEERDVYRKKWMDGQGEVHRARKMLGRE